jgi:hypothetical protein
MRASLFPGRFLSNTFGLADGTGGGFATATDRIAWTNSAIEAYRALRIGCCQSGKTPQECLGNIRSQLDQLSGTRFRSWKLAGQHREHYAAQREQIAISPRGIGG